MSLIVNDNPYGSQLQKLYKVAKKGYKVYKAYNKKQEKRTKSFEKSNPRRMAKSVKTGYYQGGFKTPKRVPKKGSPALALGYKAMKEVQGTAKGTDVVYAGSSTLDLDTLSQVVAVAILRKLFKKGGVDVTDAGIPLRLNATTDTNSVGYMVNRIVVAADGATTTQRYQTVIGETLLTLAANCGLKSEITDYAYGTSGGITSTIELGVMDTYTIGADSTFRLKANLNLRNEIVHVNMQSTINIQNRTKGANETGDNVDVVDNQPLKGKMYVFKRANPSVKIQTDTPGVISDTDSLFSRWGLLGGGVKLFSDDTAGFPSDLKEPPQPHFFTNCAKVAYVNLEPGMIKEHTIFNRHVMYYERFVRSLAWYNGADGSRRQTIADCVLFGLEERINTGSANKVSLAYEAQNTTSAFLKTGPAPTIKAGFSQQNFSM